MGITEDLTPLGYAVVPAEEVFDDGDDFEPGTVLVTGFGVTNEHVLPADQAAASTRYQHRASTSGLIQQAHDYFAGNYQNWASMTAAQKDTAARQSQRALANITKWLLGQFDTGGD